MEISANFAFLKQEFPHAAESASFAERHVFGDTSHRDFSQGHSPWGQFPTTSVASYSNWAW